MIDKLTNYDNNTYRAFTMKQNIDKAIHTLEGILKGFSMDNDISNLEIKTLNHWLNKHYDLMQKPPLNELLNILDGVCKYQTLNADDKESILYFCQNLNETNIFYNDETSGIQILHGILHGIIADEHISIEELKKLRTWLNKNKYLEGFYPYDEIKSLIYTVLQNNQLSIDEENLLKVYFSQFADVHININNDVLKQVEKQINKQGICVINPTIKIKNSLFCFTGKSKRCQRTGFAQIITDLGGKFNDRIVVDTNYLIVGNEGSPDWAYSCYGRKIERAIQLRKQGNTVKIINELDFWKLIDSIN